MRPIIPPVPATPLPLSDAVDGFLAALRAAQRSPNTLAAYRRDLEAIAELLVDPVGKPSNELIVADLTVALREAFGLRASVSAPATMARTHSTWKRFCRFLITERHLVGDPMVAIEKVKQPQPPPRSIDHPHLAADLTAAAGATPPPRWARTRWPARDVAIVSVLVTTGIRLQELVDLHGQSITGQQGGRQLEVIGKGRRWPAIPISDQLAVVVARYQHERRERFARHRTGNGRHRCLSTRSPVPGSPPTRSSIS